jgi:hypothetical protein
MHVNIHSIRKNEPKYFFFFVLAFIPSSQKANQYYQNGAVSYQLTDGERERGV